MNTSVLKYMRAQLMVKQKNATGDEKDGETKRVQRCVQMCIHEYLVNHILNKSETIFVSIPSVM